MKRCCQVVKILVVSYRQVEYRKLRCFISHYFLPPDYLQYLLYADISVDSDKTNLVRKNYRLIINYYLL